MLIFRGLSSSSKTASRASRARAITIGNFDGVHLGHQALLREIVAQAKSHGLASTVVTFDPHPKSFFSPDNAPGRIQTLRDKAGALQALGIEELCIVRFRSSVAKMSAEDFMNVFLHQELNAKYIVVGDDFCFGARRRGNFEMLHDAGRQFGWQVASMHTVLIEGNRASSSNLRLSLQRGEMHKAAALMGMPYQISGHVIHGKKLGRTLGFPTLNIAVPKDLVLSGIFAVRVSGLGATSLAGVASLGRRPTVEQNGKLLLEVHLLDWQADAYGKIVCVQLLEKLRDEAQYADTHTMTEQIAQDARKARQLLSEYVH